jgi:C-terminal processing protease CtpA/Prc
MVKHFVILAIAVFLSVHSIVQSAQIPASDKSGEEILVGRTGKGIILKDDPSSKVPVKEQLSKEEQIDNFEILSRAIDRYYSFFEIKKIDWDPIVSKYRTKVQQASTTKNYYNILYQFVKELKDTHSWLHNYKDVPELEPYSPPIITAWINNQVVVTAVNNASKAYREGLRPGCVIQSVNGTSIPAYLNKIRPYFNACSSERIYYHNAAIKILCGEKDSKIQFKFVPYGSNQSQTIALIRTVRLPKDPAPEPPFSVSKGKYVWHGKYSEQFGYIRITSFAGREDIADEFDTALESLRDTDAILLDIRDNPGGFGTSLRRIVGRLISKTTPGVIMYRRNGPQHGDFVKTQSHYEPVGPWQYTKPIGLLMNTTTGSASDLFAAALIGADRVIAMGQPTHGNSSGDCVYIQLPCDLIVRISCGYLSNAKGRITEVNGNQPEVPVEPRIDDILQNKDGVLERAFEYLKTPGTRIDYGKKQGQ